MTKNLKVVKILSLGNATGLAQKVDEDQDQEVVVLHLNINQNEEGRV